MSGYTDTADPRALWLDRAIRLVVGLSTQLLLRDGVRGLAIQLLRSIEADSLPVPAVYSTSQGTIRITWKHGHRMLFLSVMGPDRFLCGRIDGGVTLAVRTIRRNRVEEMRGLVSWLTPSANHMLANVYLMKSKP